MAGQFGLTENEINQPGGTANPLATVTDGVGDSGGGGPMAPFALNPWSSPFGEQTANSMVGGLNDPMGQASRMFQANYGHADLTNPFFNRFYNELAPGLGSIFSLLDPGSENPAGQFGGYMQNYLNALATPGFEGTFGRSDLTGLVNQIFSGAADDPMVAQALQTMTDREIMSLFGDVVQTAGYTSLTPLAAKGLMNGMQQMLANWRGAALDYGPEQAGNAFLNYVAGSGILDRLGF